MLSIASKRTQSGEGDESYDLNMVQSKGVERRVDALRINEQYGPVGGLN